MDDAVGVGVGERAGDIAQDADHFPGGERPALEPAAKTVAVHVGHAEPRQPAGIAGGEHRDHLGMLQLGGQKHLAPKPLDRDSGQQLRREHLHHHPPVQRVLQREIGTGHPPPTQLALDRVSARQHLLQSDAQLVHLNLCSGWRNMPSGQR